MGNIIDNVLVKLVGGGRVDHVLFIDNVPEEMFYEMRHPKKVEGEGRRQVWREDTTQPKVPTLYEDLSLSQTGDGGIVFDLDREEAAQRYNRLRHYIKSVYPANLLPPEPVPYAQDPTDSSSGPKALRDIPRAVLPSLSPRVSNEPLRGGSLPPELDVEAVKRKAVEEFLEKQNKERMAKVRAARENKAETENAETSN